MKQKKVWIWFLIMSLCALVLWRTGVQSFVREVVYPFDNVRVWFERVVWIRCKAVASRVHHASRNAMLERDISRLRSMAAQTETLEAEVMRLRTLLEYVPADECSWVVAAVVSRGGITGTMQSLRLAKGSLSGIRRGDAVVVPDGVVGRVVEVSLHTSEVMLITDPNSRVACEIEQPEIPLGSVRGILYGGGTRIAAESSLRLLYVVEPLRLRYLGREFEPPVRARIVTSGLGETFPGGLTVGYLLESSLDAGELTREAEIMPAVELSSVEDVFVLSRNRRSHAQ